ncbi:unnamed protein product [Rhizophagus irregularis]|uniref:Uncharacterized protein n=1 Tax=Rhizophagus irregularis TaxID=588596 RepID=A0A2N1NW98_9GLOM|nr:hypothetical protein RhiirC2_706086 [Rhizophagus irregularis]CAB4381429.1 unnamed protein product [Rhizophagus irregularis]CAB5364736.1 unnamed protein product [Rhizophagus irregularis]
MNQKRFIILFALLIFFLIHVEKTHACYPSGSRSFECKKEFDGVKIKDAKWSPDDPLLIITTYVPDGKYGRNAPEAFGHFTFKNDKVYYKFLRDPHFFNDHHCEKKGPHEVNPYVSYHQYEKSQRPAKGTWVEIRLAIYWGCKIVGFPPGGPIDCCHKNVVYKSLVQ